MLTRKFYSLLFIFSVLLGCDKPDSTPELRDPVYQDLKSEESKVKKEVDAKLKELEEHKSLYSELSDSDYQKKITRGDIYNVENEIKKLTQKVDFYRISAESRQIFARKQYLEYYKAGKSDEWPPKSTKDKYEQQKKLSQNSKQWTRGMASTKPAKKEDKKSSH